MEPFSDKSFRRSPPEILAPAGGRAQFFSALNAGADAVYLGLKSFNARSRAENFSPEDLQELVPLARASGMKVLVTVNVLVKDVELKELIETLAILEDLAVDAIIVQDLAVAEIARTSFPGIRLHASTQMAVHNLAGVRRAQALGFRRVVLARELTAQEVRKIRSKISREDIELEVFCHGSLCYSYSGLCFFSGAEDARSGNRGECAYTCRQPYKILNEPGHGFLFSMRDLDTSKALDALIGAGVDTLKIEGRKKDAQYVASTVRLYRQALNRVFGRETLREAAPRHVDVQNPEDDLKLSFQRQTTSLFVRGRYHENVIDLDNPTHSGVRLGAVESSRGRRIALTLEHDVERFDGLRLTATSKRSEELAARYENKNPEFSLRDFSVGGSRAFVAKKGQRIEIELPADVPLPTVGDAVHKIRSADLKRRIDALSVAPLDARVKPWRYLDEVVIELERTVDGMISVTARALKHGVILGEEAMLVDLAVAKSGADLERDLVDAFTTFGDSGFLAGRVQVNGATPPEGAWFVPRSKIKALKVALSRELGARADALLDSRRERALKRFAGPLIGVDTGLSRDASFSIKCDRVDTISAALRFCEQHPDHRLDEIIFEPKKAFLADLSPEKLASDLVKIRDACGVHVRLALPTVVRAWDEPLLRRWFTGACEQGLSSYEVGNLGGFDLLAQWGLPKTDVAADFTLYALNSVATNFWLSEGVSRVTLSIEDDLPNIKSHVARLPLEARAKLQVILFKDTPLFIAEACSLTALHKGCPTAKVCGYRTLEVENPKGERFFVAHESCKSIVYGEDAYSITQHRAVLESLGISRFRVDYLTRAYDAEQVARILSDVLAARPIPGTHAANFERRLL